MGADSSTRSVWPTLLIHIVDDDLSDKKVDYVLSVLMLAISSEPQIDAHLHH